MGVHNLTFFYSECVNLEEIIWTRVKTHECVMLIRDIYIRSISVKSVCYSTSKKTAFVLIIQ